MLYLTPQEVARQLRVSIYTVRRWLNTGELPGYKVGRNWRVSVGELEGWLARRHQPHMKFSGEEKRRGA